MRKGTSTKKLFARAVLAFFALLTHQVGFAQYCLPTYGTPCTSDDYINQVTFAGINNVGTGCGTPGVSNYTDYSGIHTANIVANQPYTMTCAPGPTWGQYFVALIDLNHDNDFTDAGEFFDIGYSFGGGTVSNTITVPCNAMTGPTRLRVMCRYANTPLTLLDICATGLSFGEVEDYNVVISQPTATDARMVRFVTPVTACGMTANETVSVRVANVGGQTINGFTVCYRIGAGAPVCQTVATVIPPCDSVLHTFSVPADLSVTGQYNFRAYVTAAGDLFPSNDTVSNHIVDNIPVIGSLPYTQNFDVTNGGWTTTGTSSSWAWGVPSATFIPSAASPTRAWVTNLSGLYNPDETSYLVSPCFNLTSVTSSPYLAFSHIFETDGFADFDFVEVSTNSGNTWSKVGTFGSGNNWYNDQSGDYWTGTSGNAGDWQSADHQLTGTAGFNNVRFRFAFTSDAFNDFEGIGIDDVKLLDTLKNAGVLAFVSPTNGCQLSSTQAVSVSIQNFGSHPISNVPVCYTFQGGPANCEIVPGPIAPGATFTHTFATTVNMAAPQSYNLVGYTNWSSDYTRDNDTARTMVQSFPLVNSFPYRETFEASSGGWASDGTSGNDWAYGTPAKTTIVGASTGTKAWVTAGLGSNFYQDNANSWVESPCFDLTTLSNPWVTAKIWWNSETSWDGTVLEYTTNGGATWVEIGAFGDPYNWYTDNNIDGLILNGGSGNGWTGRASTNDGSGGYVLAKHDISALAGLSSVRFRVHFATDASVVDDGFAFDDFVVAEPPLVSLGPDTTVCTSAVLSTNHTLGAFTWSTGETTSSITVTTPGSYSLAYLDTLGLVGFDTIVVSFTPTPAVNLGNDAVICHGDTNCLIVNPGLYSNIHWSTGDTASTICVTTAGNWTVSAEDALGCASSDTITTTVVAVPTPSIGADTTLCLGDTLCLSANCDPNNSHIWSNGATTSTICVTVIAGYWVQCTDSNGCMGGDSIIVTQGALPVAIAAADTSNCPIVQFSNSSTGTGSIWDFGDGGNSTQANPSHDYTAAGNGSYTVTLISQNDCGNDTTTIQVDINCLVSIGSALDNQLKLFPNPTRGQFKLETMLSGSAAVNVTILDLHGKTVYHHDFGQAAGRFSEQINLQDQGKGVYFVKFDVGGQVTVKKLVLQ
ncbi:MAG TPA: GEVED domain-containing protein [Bacteroidia bacterium]|nr:GEVED domain-containing protein [Bacteroidia bacterium]